jgi:hypothetical protein
MSSVPPVLTPNEVTPKWSRGDLHPETGMRYWSPTSRGGDWWVNQEKFEALTFKAQTTSRHWARANREKMKVWARNWRHRNPEKVRAYKNRRHQERYNVDPLYTLACRVRGRLRSAIRRKAYCKNCLTHEMLGCDFTTLKEHLESKFLPGMTWKDSRKWHIDHKIPLSSAKTPVELFKLCHYTNLQPLWAIDNLRKHTSYERLS